MKLYLLLIGILLLTSCSEIKDIVNESFKEKTAEELSYDEDVIFIPLTTTIEGVIDTINIGDLLDENDVSHDKFKGFEIDELEVVFDSISDSEFEEFEGYDIVGRTPIILESGEVILNRSSDGEFPESENVVVADIDQITVADYIESGEVVDEIDIDYQKLNTVFGGASLDDNTIIKISMKRSTTDFYKYGGFKVNLVIKMHFYVL